MRALAGRKRLVPDVPLPGRDQKIAGGAEVRDAARSREPDRYLAALLSPREARDDLIALAAFLGEVARIRESVRDPLLAEIRLQWWRDAIAVRENQRTGNPIADAFRRALHGSPLREADLFHSLVLDILDAHGQALHAPPIGIAALETYAARTDGNAFRLAGAIIGADPLSQTIALYDEGGRAYGLARTLASPSRREWTADASPMLVAARKHLTKARKLSANASSNVLGVMLPLALVEPYLRAFERQRKFDRARPWIMPLTRVWRIWRAKRLGRF